MDALIGTLVSLFAGGILMFIVVMLLLLLTPEKFDKWASNILRLFAFVGTKVRKNVSKRNIQGGINSFAKRLSVFSEVDVEKVTIRWVSGENAMDHEWKDGSIILILEDKAHQQKNFVYAAYLFTSATLLKGIKSHLSKKQSLALDLFTTKKLIETEAKNSIEFFNRDILNPLILGDKKLEEIYVNFDDIDKAGFYLNVLIPELNSLSGQVILSLDKSKVREDVSGLIGFLRAFSCRIVGDDSTESNFVGDYMKCSIQIVSRRETRERGNIGSPARRLAEVFSSGIRNMYVIGPQEGKDFVDDVCTKVNNDNDTVTIAKCRSFKGIITNGDGRHSVVTYMVLLQKTKLSECC